MATPNKRTLRNLFTSTFEKFVIIFTIFSALYIFFPAVSIETNDSFSTANPFEKPFYVYNSGNTPIENFDSHLWIDSIEVSKNIKLSNFGIKWKAKTIRRLGAGKKSFLSLERALGLPWSKLKKANIGISYSYKVPFIPYKFTEDVFFQDAKTNSGKIIWLHNN